jgi:hypothetical protein
VRARPDAGMQHVDQADQVVLERVGHPVQAFGRPAL